MDQSWVLRPSSSSYYPKSVEQHHHGTLRIHGAIVVVQI